MKSAPVASTPTRTFVHAAPFKIGKSPAVFQDRPWVLRLNVGGGVSLNTGGARGTLIAGDEGREQQQRLEKLKKKKKNPLKMLHKRVTEEGGANRG